MTTGNLKSNEKVVRSFQECREYARSLELSSRGAWEAWCKVPGNRPDNVPSDPRRTYENKGWTNWGDFLGTGNKVGGQKKK